MAALHGGRHSAAPPWLRLALMEKEQKEEEHGEKRADEENDGDNKKK